MVTFHICDLVAQYVSGENFANPEDKELCTYVGLIN